MVQVVAVRQKEALGLGHGGGLLNGLFDGRFNRRGGLRGRGLRGGLLSFFLGSPGRFGHDRPEQVDHPPRQTAEGGRHDQAPGRHIVEGIQVGLGQGALRRQEQDVIAGNTFLKQVQQAADRGCSAKQDTSTTRMAASWVALNPIVFFQRIILRPRSTNWKATIFPTFPWSHPGPPEK